ncbi:5901_t:CDS:2 [Ambispora leptoticha]|uniref:5901_t:CDS:1 n=1 Tax=Ambispora leptoticha TaxID=144679 RepID=A0A9N9FKC7_9GLOM|nr:5901_t:CDS:2 [Ambispora leptoticha]
MVKVLVLGATGFLGNALATAFARAGHQTYGLVRSQVKAKVLEKEEIIVVVADINEPAKWSSVAEKVDVVVDATVDYQNPVGHVERILSTVESASRKRVSNGAQKLVYIFTSGIWVYGENGSNVLTESSLPNNPPKHIAWRIDVEKKIISSTDVNGIVFRPGTFYGKGGSLTAIWFNAALQGDLKTPGKRDLRWAVVHVDDLADAYVRAAERAELVKGQIFIVANNQSESISDCLEAVARVTGYKSDSNKAISFVEPDPANPIDIGRAISNVVDSSKVRNLLGWKQQHLGFVDGIDFWWASFKAHNL